MGFKVHKWWFLMTILTCLQPGLKASIQIGIIPDTYNQIMQKDIQISCTLDDQNENVSEILLLKIDRGEDIPVVFIRHGENLSYNSKAKTTNLMADGHIDKEVKKSYLKLTIVKPTSQDDGVYTCVMVYLDQVGHLNQIESSKKLTEQNFEQTPLEQVLINKTHFLEKVIKEKAMRLKALEDEFKTMKSEVSYASAFSASIYSNLYFSKGDRLVFSNMLMRVGTGYNSGTGIYTAPRNGLYVFTFAFAVEDRRDGAYISIVKNGGQLASCQAYDDGRDDHSSCISVTKLVTNDKVWLVAKEVYNSGTDINDEYRLSVFNGFLLQPL